MLVTLNKSDKIPLGILIGVVSMISVIGFDMADGMKQDTLKEFNRIDEDILKLNNEIDNHVGKKGHDVAIEKINSNGKGIDELKCMTIANYKNENPLECLVD